MKGATKGFAPELGERAERMIGYLQRDYPSLAGDRNVDSGGDARKPLFRLRRRAGRLISGDAWRLCKKFHFDISAKIL